MPARPIPIITRQRRLVEVGRIRLGKKVPTQNGHSRPAKLDKFRLTSRDRSRLDAAAELYGGTVQEWEGQWELYTDRDAIPVAVVPAQALSIYYELWGQVQRGEKKSPVICLRRCDGELETKSDGPCICAGEEEMSCRPTVRLSVVLPEVPGLGVWRVESHGWNAASELQGTVELLEALVATGRPVRARLRLDKRESPHEQGTRKFVVPVIDIDHTLAEVLDSLNVGRTIELGSGAPTFTPVAALPAAPAPSVAEQIATANEPKERPARANAQEPMKRTGLAPRTVTDLLPRELNEALKAKGLPLGGTPEEMQERLQSAGGAEGEPVSLGEVGDGDAPDAEINQRSEDATNPASNGSGSTASPNAEGGESPQRNGSPPDAPDPTKDACTRCGSTRASRMVVQGEVVCEIVPACRGRQEAAKAASAA